MKKSLAPALVNRIDRNTGGIVIAAKNAESLRILNAKMKTRELENTISAFYTESQKGQRHTSRLYDQE